MNAAAGEQPEQDAAESATPGELLRGERERRRLSIQQAAEDLHLDTWVVEAIEANRFVALGAPVYAKGHLRKYASLLGLPPEAVIERYERLSDTPVAPTPIPASVNAPARIERISLKAPLLIVAALLALGVAWQVFEWLRPPPQSVVTVQTPPSPTQLPEAGVLQSAPTLSPTQERGPEAVTEPVAQPPPQATQASPPGPAAAVEPSAAAEPAAATAGEQVQLRLEFSEASWTEVYDGEGNRLMFDLGAPGRVRNLSGTPPLHVTLGAAAAVSAQVNGEPIVIPRRADRNASTFMIDAAGAVAPARDR